MIFTSLMPLIVSLASASPAESSSPHAEHMALFGAHGRVLSVPDAPAPRAR